MTRKLWKNSSDHINWSYYYSILDWGCS